MEEHTDIFCRLRGICPDIDMLADKRIVIIGLGSGGNDVAFDLARCGVASGMGKMLLMDPDLLEVTNLPRFTASCGGIQDVGRLKVEIVAEKLKRFSPTIHLETQARNVLEISQKALDAMLADVDLILSCTGSIRANLWINRIAWTMQIPSIYAAVYAHGSGGEVLFVDPKKNTACYDCFLGHRPLDAGSAVSVVDYADMTSIDDALDLPGESALGLDVRAISLIQSKWALITLLGRDIYEFPAGCIFFGNRPGLIFKKPLEVLYAIVEKRGNCGSCSEISP